MLAGGCYFFIILFYNTVKPNLNGSAVLLQFRDSFSLKFKKSKDKEKKNSGLDIFWFIH